MSECILEADDDDNVHNYGRQNTRSILTLERFYIKIYTTHLSIMCIKNIISYITTYNGSRQRVRRNNFSCVLYNSSKSDQAVWQHMIAEAKEFGSSIPIEIKRM